MALKISLEFSSFDFSPSVTIVTCYASVSAVRVVLSPLQAGLDRSITFDSSAFSPSEQKYSVEEQEALA